MKHQFMHPHYRGAVTAMLAVLGGLVVACGLAMSWAGSEDSRFRQADLRARENTALADRKGQEFSAFTTMKKPVDAFTKAWKPFVQFPKGIDVGSTMRTEIEQIAQRRLGLITDQATTPPPMDYTFQGVTYSVQKVSMRASGSNLPKLLNWLGEVEQKYPFARVEVCSLEAQAGANMSCTLTLTQPLMPKSKSTIPTAQ